MNHSDDNNTHKTKRISKLRSELLEHYTNLIPLRIPTTNNKEDLITFIDD